MTLINHVAENLYRGPRPDSYVYLEACGITKCISLQSGFMEEVKDDNLEKELPGHYGVEQLVITCSDIIAPRQHEVLKFLRAVDFFGAHKTYVHCLHGKDRTGFMIAVFRMRILGWSYDRAVEEMYQYGFHKWPYQWLLRWTEELKKYEVGK